MIRWVIDNLSLLALALFGGVAAWALVSLSADPFVDRALVFKVAQLGGDARADVSITTTLPPTVTVNVHGQTSSVQALENGSLTLNVDLRQLPAGEGILPLTPTLDAPALSLVSVQPATARFAVVPLVSQPFTVNITVQGAPGLGFRVGAAQVTPPQVVVTASREAISAIASVDAVISADGARSSIEQNARVFARAVDGTAIGGVRLSSEFVQARVTLEQLSNYRDLPVVVRWRGQPADGYAVTSITAEPQIVTVFGAVDAIQNLKGYVETQEVSITGAKANVSEKAGLIMPPGVSLVNGPQMVAVSVSVDTVQGSRTIKRAPVVIGVTQGLTATVSPESINLVLIGPLPRLAALTEDDVRIVLDVTGLSAGNYQLTPRVILPDGVLAQSLVPTSVQVQLAAQKKKP